MTRTPPDGSSRRSGRRRIRVLLADDSPTVRHALAHMIEADPELELVGVASDGEEAVRLALALRPDLVTMDVGMPLLDGLEATRRIMSEAPTPIVIISGMPGLADAEVSFEALRAGAVDMIAKPERVTLYRDAQRRDALLAHLKRMAGVAVVRRRPTSDPGPPREVKRPTYGCIGVGASTGGPPVVLDILSGLSASSPAVLVTQHMARGFIEGFVTWLGQKLPVPVTLARDRERIECGHVYVAPSGVHLTLANAAVIRLVDSEPVNFHLPSVDPLFDSLATHLGPSAAGFLLTGMGRDGARGLERMRAAGGLTCAQDEASSTVFGMPRAAIELGAAAHVESVSGMARIVRQLRAPSAASR